MTKGAGGTAALVAAAIGILSACNGTLRFDETPLDAAREGPDATEEVLGDAADPADGVAEATTDAAPPADGAADAAADAPCNDASSASCGWRQADCGPDSDDGCEWICAPGLMCTSGACGTGCGAECLQNSTCAIATGDVSHVECKAAASCTITLGGGANAACATGSTCHVRCAGRCAMICQAGATCQLRCGDAPDFTTVTGTASCP